MDTLKPWYKHNEFIVSMASLIIAFIVAWTTLLSPANLLGRIAKNITLANVKIITRGVEKKIPGVTISVSLVNSGAQTGVIDDILLKVYFGSTGKGFLFKPARETSTIMVITKSEGEIDTKVHNQKVIDVFSPVILTSKSTIQKKYHFIPFKEEKIDVPELPYKIKVELLLKNNDKWKQYHELTFINDIVDFNKELGWAILESEESKSAVNRLLQEK